jgi:hypothetical protein
LHQVIVQLQVEWNSLEPLNLMGANVGHGQLLYHQLYDHCSCRMLKNNTLHEHGKYNIMDVNILALLCDIITCTSKHIRNA